MPRLVAARSADLGTAALGKQFGQHIDADRGGKSPPGSALGIDLGGQVVQAATLLACDLTERLPELGFE